MLHNKESNLRPEDIFTTSPFLGDLPGHASSPSISRRSTDTTPVREIEMVDMSGTLSLTGESQGHTKCKYLMVVNKDGVTKRTKRNRCWWCYNMRGKVEKLAMFYCLECDVPLCVDCDRDCWSAHVAAGGVRRNA